MICIIIWNIVYIRIVMCVLSTAYCLLFCSYIGDMLSVLTLVNGPCRFITVDNIDNIDKTIQKQFAWCIAKDYDNWFTRFAHLSTATCRKKCSRSLGCHPAVPHYQEHKGLPETRDCIDLLQVTKPITYPQCNYKTVSTLLF